MMSGESSPPNPLSVRGEGSLVVPGERYLLEGYELDTLYQVTLPGG
jgi:hypothetical protein